MSERTAVPSAVATREDDPLPPNPKAVGEVSESLVLARLIQLGYSVSLPFGNNQRYDFIVDDGESLRRVQVKTGRLQHGNVVFPTRSTNGFTGQQRGYLGQADDFVVYCPETNEIYRVPVADCGDMRRCYLRVEERRPLLGRGVGVRWAHSYVFEQPVSDRGQRRKPRPTSFSSCATKHPGKPSRIKEKSAGQGQVRWYCMECHAAWSRRRDEERRS